MTDATDYNTCRYCGADLDEEHALAASLRETQLPCLSCGQDTGGTARCFECDSSAWCGTCDGPYPVPARTLPEGLTPVLLLRVAAIIERVGIDAVHAALGRLIDP